MVKLKQIPAKYIFNFLVNLGNYFFDFFFPKICLFCKDRIVLEHLENDSNISSIFTSKINNKSTEYFCGNCKAKIEFAPPKDEIISNLVTSFPQNQLAISNAVSLFSSSEEIPAFELIYKLKYQGFTKIGVEYGTWLGKILADYNLKQYDFIVPVPIHKIKKRERGYNQSDFIARGVNKIIQVPIAYDLLIRIKHTKSQTQLNSVERKTNLLNVFRVNDAYDLRGKKILLIDDVLTTGSTVNNCALALLEGSASLVDVATLLKA